MNGFDEQRLNEAVARVAKTAEGQVFLCWLHDYLGYGKPMEHNKDVAFHSIWVALRDRIPARDRVTIENDELRDKPITEEMDKLCLTTTDKPTIKEAELTAAEPFHRTRMSL